MLKSITRLLIGAFIVILGILFVIFQPQKQPLLNLIRKQAIIIEGTELFDKWLNITLHLKVYLFNITNPLEILDGGKASLQEIGPYYYDIIFVKQILRIKEDTDEVEFNYTKTYYFNQANSGKCTEDDQVTILNMAYIGTINQIATQFPAFVPKYGPSIIKLFPKAKDVFIKTKVKNMLFDGLLLTCDKDKYPDLALVCGFLKNNKPPILEVLDDNGHYKYSVFGDMNGTTTGIFTVNRGVKNISRSGELVALNGKAYQNMWNSDECNKIRGSDSTIFAPLQSPVDHLYTYVAEICRLVIIRYSKDVIVHGINGNLFEKNPIDYTREAMKCYYVINKNTKKPIELQQGLIDLEKCKKLPLIGSEPHFLFGDPNLLDYVDGLKPNKTLHNSFGVIDPYTGTTLRGAKRFQFNLDVKKYPLKPYRNISDGYFPLFWVEEGKDTSIELLMGALQAQRILNLVSFLVYVPICIGVSIIFTSLVELPSRNKPSVYIVKTASTSIPNNGLMTNNYVLGTT